MGKIYLLLACVIALSVGGLALPSEQSKPFYKPEDYERHFEEFIKEYGRNYTNEEKKYRFEVFKQKLPKMNELNLEYKHGIYGINMFTDYAEEDFAKLFHRKLQDNNDYCTNKNGTSFADVEDDSFDWRDHNVVTKVKNQGPCGSCWAFSVTGNVEGQYAIKNKKLLEFSEQQLVDCDKTGKGCNGSKRAMALRDIINKGGIMAEEDYKYNGKPDQQCQFDKSKVKVTLSDCIVYQTDEDKLKSILKNVGPITVAMDATDFVKTYKGGIDERPCVSHSANHDVLLVGYGSENGVPYWILKNSWGAEYFGENGYFRLKRGIDAHCLLSVEKPATAVII